MAVDEARRVGLRAMADLATPMAVRVAATLRVADHIAAGFRTAADIATVTGTHPGALDRLLRHLVTIDLLADDEPGVYTLTESGEHLRENHAGGMRKWLDIHGAVGRGDLSFVELAHTIRTGSPAYAVRYGVPFWEDLASDDTLSASFDVLMGHHIDIDNSGITEAYDWTRLRNVVDVGGGNGALLGKLLCRYPGLRGTLVELPGPAEAARSLFQRAGLTARTETVTGSFFDPLPPGSDGYLLSSVIHNWDDEHATAILRRCSEAATDDGVVLVVEAINTAESPNTAMDLRMLVYTGGRERTLGQIAELAGNARLAVRATYPITPTSLTSVIELVKV
ncbi:methyltransferase [Haloechinothrix sp. YIM 98757]|uniref:Methyltransferase n=1 Tax=Haloechinothrix aidingensis TaxID=2752311 RepID=A0A838A297_9PSEU|nr:methyltransferase [Haloechinothrix aidingensis]MBA0125313.1 methyltransferase [Haloechinothrix aidingensis]